MINIELFKFMDNNRDSEACDIETFSLKNNEVELSRYKFPAKIKDVQYYNKTHFIYSTNETVSFAQWRTFTPFGKCMSLKTTCSIICGYLPTSAKHCFAISDRKIFRSSEELYISNTLLLQQINLIFNEWASFTHRIINIYQRDTLWFIFYEYDSYTYLDVRTCDFKILLHKDCISESVVQQCVLLGSSIVIFYIDKILYHKRIGSRHYACIIYSFEHEISDVVGNSSYIIVVSQGIASIIHIRDLMEKECMQIHEIEIGLYTSLYCSDDLRWTLTKNNLPMISCLEKCRIPVRLPLPQGDACYLLNRCHDRAFKQRRQFIEYDNASETHFVSKTLKIEKFSGWFLSQNLYHMEANILEVILSCRDSWFCYIHPSSGLEHCVPDNSDIVKRFHLLENDNAIISFKTLNKREFYYVVDKF